MLNPYLIIGLLVGFIATAVGGFWSGMDYQQGRQAKEHARQLEEAKRKADELLASVNVLSAELEAERAKVKVKDRIIIKEVVRYEQIVPAARRVELDGAWRVLHDAAATGEPAESAAMADGAADRVTDASALETVAENYADCRDWRAKVIGWQEFWSKIDGQRD